jgi:hypothetical protein
MPKGIGKGEIEAIGDAAPKHDRVNDYEPKAPTAEELKLAGVTLLAEDPSLVYLQCDHCEMQWAGPKKAAPASWICPNVSGAE